LDVPFALHQCLCFLIHWMYRLHYISVLAF
jgi:hypothetical protein